MAIKRVFLNWDRPGLTAAADYLSKCFGSAGVLDLDGVVIVVPGSRAGRRLEEILLQRAGQRKSTLKPPAIETVGKLPEQLYVAEKPFAEELVQQLAWVQALHRADPRHVKQLISNTPAADDQMAWLALGAMLGRLHRELAADGLNFQGVADCGSALEEFREHDRWQALAEIQQCYLEILDSCALWDRQTARLFAIRQGECHTEKQIVLVGLVDMNRAQRLMLDQVADRVTTLIFAPEELAGRFDEYGCVRPKAWLDVTIDLSTEQIEVVGNPTDQAAAVVRALASLDGRYAAEQIVIGVADERIVPQIDQQLQQCGIRARYGPGVSVAQSGPYRLLQAVADHLESDRFATFAALVRHPDVEHWLTTKNLAGDWLSEMDQYYANHLPYRLSSRRLGGTGRWESLQQVCRAMEGLLQDLPEKNNQHNGEQRTPHLWGEPIVDLLVNVYGQTALDRDDPCDRTILAACEKIHQVLLRHLEIPEDLMPNDITPAEAIRLVLREVAAETIAPLPDRQAVELLGWLELSLDDAPALIVTGFNEGFVPKSVNADAFLPNRLRRELGIDDNDRRYARDAYALSVLTASREDLKVIAGRRTVEADPLSPSRLLFACDDETAARRAKAFFSPEQATRAATILPGKLRPGQETSNFQPPRPQPLEEPVASMRVTEFKDYLACPYRYYLKHCLKLRGLADADEELDGAAFGSLAHDVLKEFARSDAAESTDPEEIAAGMSQSLDRLVLRRYGHQPLAAVGVQVEQLRRRLGALAGWQADWAGQGWRIEHVESGPEDGKAAIEVDGRPMLLRGRIDRIDFNPATGRRMIFDYKSSDAAKTPDQTHRKKGQWIDLQLPLYRHLARGMGIEGPVDLGYIALPKDRTKGGHLPAEWSNDELQAADRTAEDVVRRVRDEIFWPPAEPPPAFSEEFAAICGDNYFGSPAAGDDAEGAGDE